jgi:hypothetical protein
LNSGFDQYFSIAEKELNTLFFNKHIIDDKTLLLWLGSCVFSVIGFIVSGSIIVYMVVGLCMVTKYLAAAVYPAQHRRVYIFYHVSWELLLELF